MAVIYLFTLMLLFYSSLYMIIKIGLILFLGRQFWLDYHYQNPCSAVELIYRNNQWILIAQNGTSESCHEIKIVIQNTLFQLIQCSIFKKNKILILFNDQIPGNQLRLLHLLIASK